MEVASPASAPAATTADLRSAEIARLQQDVWTLWRAISRRGSLVGDMKLLSRDKASDPAAPLVSSEALAECLGSGVEEILHWPGRLATLLDLHEKLSGLVYPATPDSIRLSEVYEGAQRPRGVEPSDWSVGRLVIRLRLMFLGLTLLALLVMGSAVFISIQAAIGSGALADANQAVEDAASVRVHNSTTRPQAQSEAQVQIDSQTTADDERDAALRRVADWASSRPVQFLTGTSYSFSPQTARAAAASNLALMTTILLPMLGGFLGAYCEFVRWFMRRLLALALTPADHMQIIVRFMLALAVTAVLAAFCRGFSLPPTMAFIPFAMAFLLGYMVSQLFGALDRVIGALPAYALATTVARVTRRAIEQTQTGQLIAMKEEIGRKIGVPEVVTYQGQLGLNLLNATDRSVLAGVPTDNDAPIPVTLTGGETYVLLVQIGTVLASLPVIRNLSVAGGKFEADITFEVELESVMLTGRQATVSATPKAGAVWSHRFNLTAPTPRDSRRTIPIWLTVRQLGITYGSISLDATVALPAIVPPSSPG